jgi:ABC-type Na+ efflux pump permease subunit
MNALSKSFTAPLKQLIVFLTIPKLTNKIAVSYTQLYQYSTWLPVQLAVSFLYMHAKSISKVLINQHFVCSYGQAHRINGCFL